MEQLRGTPIERSATPGKNTMYTLGTAAKATGLAKSTIHRAIKTGRLSARSKDGTGYEIDPAELHRVFPPVGVASNPSNSSAESTAERSATPEESGSNTVEHPVKRDVELEVRLVKAEAQLEALKEVLELERKRAEELRQERDRWASALEASQRQLTDLTKKPGEPTRKGFLRWFRTA
jgi:hypothetical protein